MIQERARYPQEIEGITLKRFSTHLLASESGQKLKNEIRFAGFKPDHVSNEDWQKVLGYDVNNFYHMPLTTEITKFFLCWSQNPPENWPRQLTEASVFNKEEGALLLFASEFHDAGEAIIPDIPSPLKTDKDREDEMKVLRKLMPEILEGTELDVLLPHVTQAIDEIVSTKTTKLGKAFRAIEETGFVRVAIRAWGRKDRVNDPILADALVDLATKVVTREMPHMEINALIYPGVFAFMENSRNKASLLEIQEAIKKP